MKNYFIRTFNLSLIGTLCFMSVANAGKITIKNDNIPDEEVNSRKARLVFKAAGHQDIYYLPEEGKTHEIKLANNFYEMIFFTNPGEKNPVCYNEPITIGPNTSFEITVGYKDKVAYCEFRREKNN